jgi:hypothetical protein
MTCPGKRRRVTAAEAGPALHWQTMSSSAEASSGSHVVVRPSLRSLVEESPGRHAQERWRCGGEPSKGGHWPSSRVSSGTVQQPPGWLRKGRQGALCSALVFKGPARIATERQPCQARDRDVVPHRGMARSGSFAKDGRGQRCSVNDWSGSLVQECKGEACRRSRSVGEAAAPCKAQVCKGTRWCEEGRPSRRYSTKESLLLTLCYRGAFCSGWQLVCKSSPRNAGAAVPCSSMLGSSLQRDAFAWERLAAESVHVSVCTAAGFNGDPRQQGNEKDSPVGVQRD